MPLMQDSIRFASACGVLLGVLLCASGCSRQDEGDFQTYRELERASEPPDRSVSSTSEIGDSAAANREAHAGTGHDATSAVADPAVSSARTGESETVAVAPQVATGASTGETTSDAVAAASPQGASVSGGPFRIGRLEAIPVEAPRPNQAPREIKLLVPTNEFRAEGPDGAVRVSYDDLDLLKVLNMDPVPVDCADYMPSWLRELDGRRIRIRGFMVPPFETTGIRHFTLARDNQICCFGRFPKEYDVIETFLRKGHETDYIQNRPFDVVGTFHIVPEADEGDLYQLYVIDDGVVIER